MSETELEAHIAIESARGVAATLETRLRSDFNDKLEFVNALQEVLKQAQQSWSTADAKNRILSAENFELSAKVRSLNSELLATKSDAGSHNDASTISQLRAALFNVQSQFCLLYTSPSPRDS